MHVIFAALARDCEHCVSANIARLIAICKLFTEFQCEIWILENNSLDDTREVIQQACANFSHVRLFFEDFESLQNLTREHRIAICRDYLLDRIRSYITNESTCLYVPVDLDSSIASSIDSESFRDACLQVLNGDYNAIFPFSVPCYYDIYALRADGWIMYDCWRKVNNFPVHGRLGNFIAQLLYVRRHQIAISQVLPARIIPVHSAFGGLGLYRLSAVKKLRYVSDSFLAVSPQCEHVQFNNQIANTVISTSLLINAPPEHLRLRMLSRSRILILGLRFLFDDLSRFFVRLFCRDLGSC